MTAARALDLAPDLTPVEDRDGRLYKREDAHRGAFGVNGAKLRACQHLIHGARLRHDRVVSAASVLSPQSAMAAVVAAEAGMACTVLVGSRNPVTALAHRSMEIALHAGADFEFLPVGYNPYLQARARERSADLGAYHLQYGITPPPEATADDLAAFHWTGGAQVANLPDSVRTLVVPFGSGNSAAGVLYGLALHPSAAPALERVVLMGIGPSRRAWLDERLSALGVALRRGVRLELRDLHGTGYARYADRMPETRDGVRFHPTYEGKVVRYLDARAPKWWTRRDGTTCLWIVGGPLPDRMTA